MNQVTYTQDQVNLIGTSFQKEIARVMQDKINLELKLLNASVLIENLQSELNKLKGAKAAPIDEIINNSLKES